MKYIPVGKILSAHGLKGEVKFRYYNEATEDFLRYASLFFKKGNTYTEFALTRKRFQKGLFYIRIEGLESPEEVFPLLNSELFVREEDLPRLEDGEYYDYQLVGLNVIDRKGEKTGTVKAVIHTKANDLLAITHGGEEVFVPLMEDFICKIDLEDSTIMIDESAYLA
jgi:16S rRNA processing protein RimM